MDDCDSDSLSAEPTVASILGIKGPLRFRPHGSSQKAHIILRRVELSDDSDDDGSSKSIVYFSLFAQKRIEVKPGKEILLAVSDGKYKDQAVIFEGDLPGEETSSDGEDDTEGEVEEESTILPSRDILPPKMRRTWTKRVSEQVSPTNSSPPPPPPPELSYTSIAVQAGPTCVMASTQTIHPHPRLHTSAAAQTTEIIRDVSTAIVQTDPVIADQSHESSTNATNLRQAADEAGSTRSLSPMELDSPSSTPQRSPALAPSTTSGPHSFTDAVDTRSRLNAGLPGKGLPALSGPEHRDADRPSIVVAQHPSSAATGGEQRSLRPINKSITRPIPTGPATLRSLTPVNAHAARVPKPVVASREPFAPIHLPKSGSLRSITGSRATTNIFEDVCPAASVTPKSSIPAKRKPVVVNPFVSGGFMTEFVGSSKPSQTPEPALPAPAAASSSVTKPTLAPLIIEDLIRASSASPMDESPISAVKVEVFTPSLKELILPSLDVGLAQKAVSLSPMEQSSPSSTSLSPNHIPNGTNKLPRSSNALQHPSSPRAALLSNGGDSSSSTPNVAERRIVSVTQPVAARMSPSRTVAHLTTVKTEPKEHSIPRNPRQMQSKALPLGNRHPLPPKPIESTWSLYASRKPSNSFTNHQRASPPPDPRSIAYISSGPSSNPLGIRPSSRPGKQRIVSQPTASASPSTSTTQQKNRKPIIVGSGWPYTRPIGGANSISLSSGNTSNSSSAQGSRTQVLMSEAKPSASKSSSQDSVSPATSKPPATLNNIIPYYSPSPPSTSEQTNASNGPQPNNIGKGPNVKSSNAQPVNGRPIAANTASSRISDSRFSNLKAIKTEPLDDQLPPDPHFLSVSQNDKAYSLIFDFTDPPPLPSSKTKGRDKIPIGPRMLDTSRSATKSQADSFANSTEKKSLGGSAPQKPKTNGTPTHPLPPKPLPISRRELDQRPRGIKRGISPMSNELKILRPPKRSFQWPVVESTHRVRVKGDGDVSIKGIAFSSDGSQFVVNCDDRTIRIWNNRNHTEVARLAHNSPVVSVAWMQGDAGIISLGEDGIVSKWTRTGQNHWQWAKIVDAGTEHRQDDEAICFAYMHDRIAIAFPKLGVKVWQWIKGTWQPQRSILRQNVTSIKFVEDGNALLGGTRDGVMWYCEIPNGTLRAYAFLKSKIYALDVNPFGNQALVAQTGGRAHLVSIKQSDNKGKVEQVYAIKDEDIVSKLTHEFGALFANGGQTVLFGSVNGYVLVWDKNKGNVVCGLDHCEDDIIQAIAIFDRNTASTDSSLITGTKQGLLNWWSQPSIPDTHLGNAPYKRFKLSPESD